MNDEYSKVGRPLQYTDELADRICEIIATHSESDRDLCKKYDFFPHVTTMRDWRNKFDYFSSRYDLAKERQIKNKIDDAYSEFDNREEDFREYRGKLYANNVRGNLLRAKVGLMRWHASILNPEKYGDKKIDDKVDKVERDIESLKENVIKKQKEL